MHIIDLTTPDRLPLAAGLTWRARIVLRVVEALPAILSDLVSTVRISRSIDPLMADLLGASHGIDAGATDIYGYLSEENDQTYTVQLFWNPLVRPQHRDWWALRWGIDDPTRLKVDERLRIVLLDLFAELARQLDLPRLFEELRSEAMHTAGRAREAWLAGRDQGPSPTSAPRGGDLSDIDPRAVDWDRALTALLGRADRPSPDEPRPEESDHQEGRPGGGGSMR